MNKLLLRFFLIITVAFFVTSCNNEDDKNSNVTKKQVIENYANIAYENYKKAYDDVVVLETAINTFTTTPTAANFTAAKTAWKNSGESYGMVH
ncbi:imelysin family protein [Flavobacterium laiguense]|uniref:Imelysin-like domain-containing protein n=1 Tax=Flavobacterium laiguense TaxID=2169409 RepID=A0A2U1JTF0_9FLAO|nr:imelysin family protein [Flavobacterium laiguense]PWA08486.1 hypothetical protein DB891_11705 [Flavobacterium laiguense]